MLQILGSSLKPRYVESIFYIYSSLLSFSYRFPTCEVISFEFNNLAKSENRMSMPPVKVVLANHGPV